MESKLLNELIAISQEQLTLLQIIANRLDDKGMTADMKPEHPLELGKSEEEMKHAKRVLAAKKAWVTIRANRAKSNPKEPNVVDDEKSTNKEQIASPEEKQEATPSPDAGKESSLATLPSKAMKCNRVTGTKEWAHFSVGCYNGCDNNCPYCWAQANKIKWKQIKVEDRNAPRPRAKEKVLAALRSGGRLHGKYSKVMFPNTHDITPVTIDYYLEILKIILEDKDSHHKILIVSKPWFECIDRLCKELAGYKDRILFRFTIGSADDAVLKFWEPEAPTFDERVKCLKHAFDNGFETSISMEPKLDDKEGDVINAVRQYVTHSIWLGSANKFKSNLERNGCADSIHLQKAEELRKLQTKEKIKELYEKWRNDPLIRWKDTLKKILGMPSNPEVGMDK